MDNACLNMSLEQITDLLESVGERMEDLFRRARQARDRTAGDGVYLRGLIEYSNVCRKNCFYCGIRKDNNDCRRYTLTEKQVLDSARFAWENRYGSVVLQGGENTSPEHIRTVTSLIRKIKELSGGELGITLSLGEQTVQTYNEWFDAGAHRYLLRIETSDKNLYESLHPGDGIHIFGERVRALNDLKDAGYQVGTGVMIGLPGQNTASLANDLLFMRTLDIDMCGMGPYIISGGTPLAERIGQGTDFLSEQRRLEATLKMIAVLRLIMPDINIAATTALQAIDPAGRLLAIGAGANVVMPNIGPKAHREEYSLYDNKPLSLDSELWERNIRYGEWGDSLHFKANKAR